MEMRGYKNVLRVYGFWHYIRILMDISYLFKNEKLKKIWQIFFLRKLKNDEYIWSEAFYAFIFLF